MKILFLTNHLKGTDGWSRISLDYINELQNLGFDVLCLTSEKSNQEKIKEYILLDSPVKYIANPFACFLTALKIKKKIAEFSPDIIHFMVEPYAAILHFLSNKKIKVFLTVHGTYSVPPILLNSFLKKKISWVLSKKYYKQVDGVIAVSNYTKNYLMNHYSGLEKKIKVITNGIDLKKHKIIDLNEKRKNKTKKVLFVGAVKPRKGIVEVVKALKYYQENFSNDFIFQIVGHYDQKSTYYQKILKKINNYNLFDKVFFLGEIVDSKLHKYYADADLFIMISINTNNHFEGFGLVFLEANAKGVPCIGSVNSGCEEAILNNKTGYSVNSYNAQEIAEKIDLILNKNSIKKQDCIDWARKNDIKFKTKQLIDFYGSRNRI